MEMVELDETNLNHLFETLQDWNIVLQGTCLTKQEDEHVGRFDLPEP